MVTNPFKLKPIMLDIHVYTFIHKTILKVYKVYIICRYSPLTLSSALVKFPDN